MPHANIYIRKENKEHWEAIDDKSAWVNERLSSHSLSPSIAVGVPKVIKSPKDAEKALESVTKPQQKTEVHSKEICKRHHVPVDICAHKH